MTIDPAMISKIQKLLSLGTNNSEKNEAESALKKAAELAEQYGLSISDINPVTNKFDNIGKHSAVMADAHHNCWILPLASFVASCFESNAIIASDEGKLYFVGTKTDIELTLWYFKLIRIKTMMAAKAKFTGKRDQGAFGYGACTEIRERLYTMFVQSRQTLRNTETKALVLCKQEDVNNKTDEFFPNTRKKSVSRPNGNLTAMLKGKELGKTMSLHRGEIKNGKSTNNRMIE